MRKLNNMTNNIDIITFIHNHIKPSSLFNLSNLSLAPLTFSVSKCSCIYSSIN
jgi:hypothetical protein